MTNIKAANMKNMLMMPMMMVMMIIMLIIILRPSSTEEKLQQGFHRQSMGNGFRCKQVLFRCHRHLSCHCYHLHHGHHHDRCDHLVAGQSEGGEQVSGEVGEGAREGEEEQRDGEGPQPHQQNSERCPGFL